MGYWKSLCIVLGLAWGALAVPITGEVRQIDGLPAVGARLEFQREVLPFGYDDVRIAAVAETDAAGRFARDLAPGGYLLSIAGWRSATRIGIEVVEGRPLDLRLGVDWPWSVAPTASGSVRVVHADGRPAPVRSAQLAQAGHHDGLDLACGCQCPDTSLVLGNYYQDRATDAEGRVRFTVQAGLVTLGARAEGAEVVRAMLVRPGERLPELELRLPQAPTPLPAGRQFVEPSTRIQVFGPDGRPLAGRWLQARFLGTAQESIDCVRTDERGMAQVHGWTGPGEWAIKVRGLSESQPVWLAMRRGAPTVRVDLTARSHGLRGTVGGDDGRPLAGCWVVAVRPRTAQSGRRLEETDDCVPGATRWSGQEVIGFAGQRPPELAGYTGRGAYFARTAADGSYQFDDLDPGRWHVVFAERGYVADEVRAVALDGTLDFALRPSHNALTGVARGADGQPLRNRPIELRITDEETVRHGGWCWQQTVLTDADGRYAVADERLPTGPCRAEASSGCRDTVERQAVLSHLAPTEFDVVLPAERVLTGRVLLPDGRPAAQAWVCHAAGAYERTAWTDADGWFRLPTKEAGTAGLVVFAEGCAAARLTADPGAAEPAVVKLAPGASVTGRVERYPGADHTGLPLTIERDSSSGVPSDLAWRDETLVDSGAFGLSCLPLGSFGAYATSGQHELGYGGADLPTTKPLTLRTQRIGTGDLVGVVRGLDGRPLAGATVQLGYGSRDEPRQVTKADGRFGFKGLRSGGWQVTARAPGLADAVAQVQVANDCQATVELRPTWQVTGRLTGVPEGWVAIVSFVPPGPSDQPGQSPPDAGVPEWAGEYPLYGLPGDPAADSYLADTSPGRRRVLVALMRQAEDRPLPVSAFWELGTRRLAIGQPPLDLVVPAERASLRVEVSGLPPTAADGRSAWVSLNDRSSGRLAALAVVAANGAVDWPCVRPGDYLLTLVVPGRAGHRQPVVLAAGQSASAACSLAEQGATVVLHSKGVRPGTAIVLCNDWVYGMTHVADDGTARVSGIPGGCYRLTFSDGWNRATRVITVTDAPVTQDLVATKTAESWRWSR